MCMLLLPVLTGMILAMVTGSLVFAICLLVKIRSSVQMSEPPPLAIGALVTVRHLPDVPGNVRFASQMLGHAAKQSMTVTEPIQ
eukprot:532501-Amphidinium_carterae.1